MKWFVLGLLLACIVAFAFDCVVQIYTKVYVDVEELKETRREVYVNGNLIEKQIDSFWRPTTERR